MQLVPEHVLQARSGVFGVAVGVGVGVVTLLLFVDTLQFPSLTQFEDGQALAYGTTSVLELHEVPLHVLTVHSLVDGVGVTVVGGFAHLQYENDPAATQPVFIKP